MDHLSRAFIIPAALCMCGIIPNAALAQKAQTQIVVETVNSIPIASVPKAQGLASNSGAQSNSLSSVASPAPNSSAPALTNVFINNVCTGSAGTGCETISSGQTSTVNTYSGANVYTFVWEIGYGTGEIAHQGGTQISSAYLVGKVPVCVSGNQYTTNCPAGSTVSGYRYEWNNGYYLNQGYAENFAAQDTSQNPPMNTYYANLTINYTQ